MILEVDGLLGHRYPGQCRRLPLYVTNSARPNASHTFPTLATTVAKHRLPFHTFAAAVLPSFATVANTACMTEMNI